MSAGRNRSEQIAMSLRQCGAAAPPRRTGAQADGPHDDDGAAAPGMRRTAAPPRGCIGGYERQ